METTGHFHHEVAYAAAVKTNTILDDTQALHSAHRVFYSYAASSKGRVQRFLLIAEFATLRLLERLHDLDTRNREGQKAKVLQQEAAFGQLVVGKIGDTLVGSPALVGPAEIEHRQERVHKEQVLDRVEALLAAVVAPLVFLVDRARDRSLGAIVGKRGGAGCSAAGSPGSASCSKRLRSSAKLRAGASPVPRSAVRRAGSRLWFHMFALPCDIPYSKPW